MRAGDLISKMLDLESPNPNFSSQNKVKSFELSQDDRISNECSELCEKLNEIDLNKNRFDIQNLRDETARLWAKFQCKSCRVNKSNRLALPCTHLVTCEHCMSNKCIICNERVTDWIEVFML